MVPSVLNDTSFFDISISQHEEKVKRHCNLYSISQLIEEIDYSEKNLQIHSDVFLADAGISEKLKKQYFQKEKQTRKVAEGQ